MIPFEHLPARWQREARKAVAAIVETRDRSVPLSTESFYEAERRLPGIHSRTGEFAPVRLTTGVYVDGCDARYDWQTYVEAMVAEITGEEV